jgi:hypothetical protein
MEARDGKWRLERESSPLHDCRTELTEQERLGLR